MRKKIRGSTDEIDWNPIELGSDVAIGISTEGRWFVDTADGVVDLENPKSRIFLLRVLESPASEFQRRLEEAIKKENSRTSCDIPAFPTFELLLAGMQAGSYWLEHALNWVDEFDLSEQRSQQISSVLREFVDDKSIPQETRHRIQKLLARMR